MHASQFVPSMFIAHEPQTPSRQERRKVSVESTLFLIQIRTSRIIGPQSRSSYKTPGAGSRQNPDRNGRFRTFSLARRRPERARIGHARHASPPDTEFSGSGNRSNNVTLGTSSDERTIRCPLRARACNSILRSNANAGDHAAQSECVMITRNAHSCLSERTRSRTSSAMFARSDVEYLIELATSSTARSFPEFAAPGLAAAPATGSLHSTSQEHKHVLENRS